MTTSHIPISKKMEKSGAFTVHIRPVQQRSGQIYDGNDLISIYSKYASLQLKEHIWLQGNDTGVKIGTNILWERPHLPAPTFGDRGSTLIEIRHTCP